MAPYQYQLTVTAFGDLESQVKAKMINAVNTWHGVSAHVRPRLIGNQPQPKLQKTPGGTPAAYGGVLTLRFDIDSLLPRYFVPFSAELVAVSGETD